MKDDTPSISQKIRAEGGSTISGVTQIIAERYYSRSEVEELSEYLKHAVAAFEARMYQHLVPRAAPPDQPYKFLYAFDIEDTDIFFGREAAGGALHQAVLKDRLTVLHAKSGAGKTSLLNAGLSPRLIREGRLPVYARAYEDPVRAVKRAVAPPSLGPWPELLPKLTLHEFLGLACAHLSQAKELVIILDQFEEFFIFWPEPDRRQPFIDALADCYEDKRLPICIVIALRKDYYSDLAIFERRLPTIFHNHCYLEAMTRQEARTAITGPVTKLCRPVSYKPALLDTLLNDLARGGMELPHLQVICTRLYESLSENEVSITLAIYEELGRARGVLSGYLQSVLKRLPGRGGFIAREVLKELVSSEATKRVLSYDTLAARVEVEGDKLDDVLLRLVDARLLRRDEVAGEITYEMSHEHLIEEIKKWVDREDLAFKRAEELLAREVTSWRTHGTLIPKDRLELLHTYREQFRGLDEETWECILHSALEADLALEDWGEISGEAGKRILLTALNDTNAEIRQRVIRTLEKLVPPIAMEPLISALESQDSNVRVMVARILGKVGDPCAVEPLIASLRDENADVRSRVAWALGKLGASHAIEPLIAAMRDRNGGVRGYAADALVAIGDPAVGSLVVILRDKDSTVREAAAKALGEIGSPRAVEPLITALKDKEIRVCRNAAWALGKIGNPHAVKPLVTALSDEDYRMRLVVVRALAALGDPRAVESLISILRHGGEDLRQRVIEEVVEALVAIGDPAVGSLVVILRDKNSAVPEAAAKALGRIGNPRAVSPLIAALRKPSIAVLRSQWEKRLSVRSEVTWALIRIGEPAVEPLLETLHDRDGDVRGWAAYALGQIRNRCAVGPLIAALQDKNQRVRDKAAESLGVLGDPRAVDPLIGTLRDKSVSVRREAAKALGKIGDPCAVEPLIAALRDEDKWVCRAAAGSLGEIGDSHAIEPLVVSLRDGDNDMRQVAAEALSKIGDPRAVKPLVNALGDKDSDVCRAAVKALKRIATPDALAALESSLFCGQEESNDHNPTQLA